MTRMVILSSLDKNLDPRSGKVLLGVGGFQFGQFGHVGSLLVAAELAQFWG